MSNSPGNWIYQATQDYAASRCLLIHRLPSGFLLAQQAVEKILKAYLLCSRNKVPRLKAKHVTDINPSHNLKEYASAVDNDFPDKNLVALYSQILEELSYSFQNKYPDSSATPRSTTTAWLSQIDELVVTLLLDVPLGASTWRSGIYWAAWPLALENQADPPWLEWIRNENMSFNAALSRIQETIKTGYSNEYGSTV